MFTIRDQMEIFSVRIPFQQTFRGTTKPRTHRDWMVCRPLPVKGAAECQSKDDNEQLLDFTSHFSSEAAFTTTAPCCAA
jgi:hypothetical protein